jgi:hypothetical protein
MKPPELSIEHPDRLNMLEEQMETFVHSAMEAALEAGYEIFEIDCVVRGLSQCFVRKHRGDAKVGLQAEMPSLKKH